MWTLRGSTLNRRIILYQRCAICPAEVILDRLVVQADPLVVLCVCCGKREHIFHSVSSSLQTHTHTQIKDTLTVDEGLLFWRDDADQMCLQVAAALFRLQPRLSIREVQVAVPLKLSPAFFTLLLVCSSNTRESTFLQHNALSSHYMELFHIADNHKLKIFLYTQLQMGWKTEAQHLMMSFAMVIILSGRC